MAEFIWTDSKEEIKIVEKFGSRLPQQQNGSDCGLFMLEFMFRAYKNFDRLTDFLDNEQNRSEQLFGSSLILKRREDYLWLVTQVSRAKDQKEVKTIVDLFN